MEQNIVEIDKIDLLNKTIDMKNEGHRLVQVCAVAEPGGSVLLYSFIKDNSLATLKFFSGSDEAVESISCLYSYAFLYENEIKELFGVNIINMNLDFNGNFYETSIKRPFAMQPAESVEADG